MPGGFMVPHQPADLADEELKILVRRHPAVLLASIGLMIVAFLAAALLASARVPHYALAWLIFIFLLARMIWKILQWLASYIIVTPHKIVVTSGLLRRRVVESSLIKVTDIRLHRSIRGLLLGHGELQFTSMSQERPSWAVNYIPYPPLIFYEVYMITFPNSDESEVRSHLRKPDIEILEKSGRL
jgi:hypothetical protein